VSAFVWTGLISYAGYAVGDNWQLVVSYLRAYGRIILTLLLIGAAVLVGRWYWRRQQAATGGGVGEEGPE
jgi:membrane protein DedA with SNARE-associated domain